MVIVLVTFNICYTEMDSTNEVGNEERKENKVADTILLACRLLSCTHFELCVLSPTLLGPSALALYDTVRCISIVRSAFDMAICICLFGPRVRAKIDCRRTFTCATTAALLSIWPHT